MPTVKINADEYCLLKQKIASLKQQLEAEKRLVEQTRGAAIQSYEGDCCDCGRVKNLDKVISDYKERLQKSNKEAFEYKQLYEFERNARIRIINGGNRSDDVMFRALEKKLKCKDGRIEELERKISRMRWLGFR